MGKHAFFYLLSIFGLISSVPTAWAEYKNPPILQAKSILRHELLKGNNHSVQNGVKNDSLFNLKFDQVRSLILQHLRSSLRSGRKLMVLATPLP
jgi:hypothetical protein